MQQKVFVTGYGIISALGKNAAENLTALDQEISGIEAPRYLNTSHRDIALGEVKASNRRLASMCHLPFRNTTSRTIFLGALAAREAIAMAGLSAKDLRSAGFVNGTTVGGMDISEVAYRKMLQGEKIDLKRALYGHDCGHSTQHIAHLLGISHYTSTISTACSSSANSIMHGGRLIKQGRLTHAIAGGSDALSLFTLNGFNSLKILDHEWCRPFDAERKGLNLGEGAAFLVLESGDSVEQRGSKPVAELIGYGNCNDAHHQTASSPQGRGAAMAMEAAIVLGGIARSQVGYVNAHGTGTENNDLSESIALQNVFGENIPDYSSTKAFTGHTLAAAGAIEAVISLFSLAHQKLFPCLNVLSPMELIPPPLLEKKAEAITHVLSNSFGFGGNCTSLLFAKA